MSITACFLNNLSLEMVTEADHANNYCYCSKCTCGKHTCPKPKPKLYPKSTFNSFYKSNFKKHSTPHRPSHSATLHRKSIFKLESETTQSHDYKPYQLDNSLIVSTPKTSAERSRYKLSTNSTYKQDFANWGHMKTESTKFTRSSGNSGIKFNATSTYSACFQSSPIANTKIVMPAANTNILCTSAESKIPATTMRASYGNFKPIPSQPIHRPDNTIPLPAFHNQYATVNSINYDSKEMGMAIRRARKGFE